MMLQVRAAVVGWLLPLISLLLVLGCGGRAADQLDGTLSDAGRADMASSDAGTLPRADASTSSDVDAMSSSVLEAGDPVTGRDAQPGPTLVRLTIMPAEATIPVGAFVVYRVTAYYSDGSSVNGSQARLQTSDRQVATVSGATAQASGVGTAKITTTLDGVSASALLIVEEDTEAATAIEVTVEPNCTSGQTLQASAFAVWSSGKRREVTNTAQWESNSASVVVGSQGQIVCLSDGAAVIAATANGARGEAKLTSSGPAPTQILMAGPSVLKPGELGVYALVAQFEDGHPVTLPASTFSSSEPKVLNFVKPDMAEAGVAGVSMVTTSLAGGKLTASKKVTVSTATLSSLAITPATLEVAPTSVGHLTAIGTFSDGTEFDVSQQVAWDVDGRVTVSVDQGEVRPLAIGTSKVRAFTNDGEPIASAQVSVPAGTPIRLTVNESITTPVGASRTPSAVATYPNNIQLDASEAVTWQITDPSIATVNGATIVGLAPGSTFFYASYGTLVSVSQQLIVSTAKMTSLTFHETDLAVAVAEKRPLGVTVSFDDGSQEDVTDSASFVVGNALLASVSAAPSSKGQLTGLAVGVTTVTATYGTQTVSTSVTVTSAADH